MTTLAYTEIVPEKMSRASGFLSAVIQLSLGMGVAVGAVMLRIAAHSHGHLSALPGIHDFHAVILYAAVLALSPVFNSLDLEHDAGAVTSGHLAQAMTGTKELFSHTYRKREMDSEESTFNCENIAQQNQMIGLDSKVNSVSRR
jgi:hypothetical protein